MRLLRLRLLSRKGKYHGGICGRGHPGGGVLCRGAGGQRVHRRGTPSCLPDGELARLVEGITKSIEILPGAGFPWRPTPIPDGGRRRGVFWRRGKPPFPGFAGRAGRAARLHRPAAYLRGFSRGVGRRAGRGVYKYQRGPHVLPARSERGASQRERKGADRASHHASFGLCAQAGAGRAHVRRNPARRGYRPRHVLRAQRNGGGSGLCTLRDLQLRKAGLSVPAQLKNTGVCRSISVSASRRTLLWRGSAFPTTMAFPGIWRRYAGASGRRFPASRRICPSSASC